MVSDKDSKRRNALCFTCKGEVMKRLIGVITLSLVAVTAAGSRADSDNAAVDAQNENWLLAKYDANGDARITQDEVSTKKLNIFRHMEVDGDGGVSFNEYESMDSAKRQALVKSRFLKLDSDQDGRVSQGEYSSYMGMFASIDSNGDGTLTENEMSVSETPEAHVTHCLLWLCLRTKMSDK